MKLFDNSVLYRAVLHADSVEDHGNSIGEYVVSLPEFEPILENEVLRSYFKNFLTLDIEFRFTKLGLSRYDILDKWILRRREFKKLKSHLDDVVIKRDEAFKKYEAFRRLVCYDNKTLEARPSK